MTVIVWDGRFLATDSLITSGGVRCGTVTKLIVRDGKAYAACGQIGYMEPLIDWAATGAKPDAWPLRGDNTENALIGVNLQTKQCISWERDVPHPCPIPEPEAWGSGGRIAMGALAMGASAPEAVAVACGLDTQCGLPVTYVDAHDMAAEVRTWTDAADWLAGSLIRRRAVLPALDGLGKRLATEVAAECTWHPELIMKLIDLTREMNHRLRSGDRITGRDVGIINAMAHDLPEGYRLEYTIDMDKLCGQYRILHDDIPIE